MLCDTDALATLPPRELRSGRGELAKYHFLTDADLLALDLERAHRRRVQIKAEVVAGDEREDPTNRRGRAILNYGHTLAHALEIAGDHDLRHGEAVAIGLVYAAAAGPSPGAHRRTTGSPSTTGCWRPTSSSGGCPPASIRDRS